MSIEEVNYANVADRAEVLGCIVPAGFALLPANFETAESRAELLLSGEATTIRKVLRNAHVEVDDILPPGERTPYIHNKSHDWSALLFVSASVLSQKPDLVSVALGVISSYLFEFFRGVPNNNVNLSRASSRSLERAKAAIG